MMRTPSFQLLSLLVAVLRPLPLASATATQRLNSSSNGSNESSFGSVLGTGDGSFAWDEVRYMYAFGDSYTFIQGTAGYPNFSFIGDLQNLSFTPSQLLADEIIFKNTSSDGANWIEFLTGCFSGRPSDCSPIQLWDFAFAGSDIDGNILPLHHPFTVPLVDQVKQWAHYAANVVAHPKERTLIAWWIGINDTGDSTGNDTISDFSAFYTTEMDSLFDAVEEALASGLTGTHMFINVPPEERTPSGLSSSQHDEQKANIDDYNSQLTSRASQFSGNHTDTPVLLFNAHAWFNWALDNADELGFANITGYCECTDPSFFWYNTGHPTEHTHRLLAQAMKDFLTSF